jgi:hypothetical protein
MGKINRPRRVSLELIAAIGYTQARAEVNGTEFAVNILLRR